MAATRDDIEKFTGQNDFGLWRIKMKALLGNLGLKGAQEKEKKIPETSTAEQKQELSKQREEIDEKPTIL